MGVYCGDVGEYERGRPGLTGVKDGLEGAIKQPVSFRLLEEVRKVPTVSFRRNRAVTLSTRRACGAHPRARRPEKKERKGISLRDEAPIGHCTNEYAGLAGLNRGEVGLYAGEAGEKRGDVGLNDGDVGEYLGLV